MKNDWLSATNFERMYDLVLAITTLSLHYKTQLSDMKIDQFSIQDIENAKEKVVSFLEHMRQALESADLNPDQIITGTNPRFGEMVIQYRVKKARRSGNFYQVTIDHVINTLQSANADNLEEVIGYLHGIRLLVDENTVTDVNNLLGDL